VEDRWKTVKLFTATLVGVEGLDLTISSNKLVSVHPFMWVVGLAMVVLGFGYVLYVLRHLEHVAELGEEGLGDRILLRLTLNGRLIKYLPAAGFLIVLGDVLYNIWTYRALDIGTHDVVALLFGFTLLVFNTVPEGFRKERNFVLYFSIALFFILVVPLMTLRASGSQGESAVDAYSAAMLAAPLAALLNAVGVHARAYGIYVEFELQAGGTATLGITTSCSGIYSFAIFSSAFLAFVIVDYQRFDRKAGAVMLLGVGAAYLANLLRMFIIAYVGYLYDTPYNHLATLQWAHANVGWILFLGWVTLFWWLIYRYLMKNRGVTVKYNQNM